MHESCITHQRIGSTFIHSFKSLAHCGKYELISNICRSRAAFAARKLSCLTFDYYCGKCHGYVGLFVRRDLVWAINDEKCAKSNKVLHLCRKLGEIFDLFIAVYLLVNQNNFITFITAQHRQYKNCRRVSPTTLAL